MLLIFDTSVLIALEREDKNILRKLSELHKQFQGPPQTTFISYYEFLLGIKKRSFKNQSKAIEFLHTFNCLPSTQKTAEILADLRYKYDAKGISINLADLIIASHAKEHNMILITRDKIFNEVEEIRKITL